jgi:hypothetical protein
MRIPYPKNSYQTVGLCGLSADRRPWLSPCASSWHSPQLTRSMIGFSIFQNFKIERWGRMHKERKDAGQKRGDYNFKHGLLGREYPRAYRSWYALRDRCNNPNNLPG